MTDMKMTGHRNVQAWNWRTWNWRTKSPGMKLTDMQMSKHEIDGHEYDGHEIDGHENAGHVSGVWIGLHGIDFDLAVPPSNRLSFHAALRRRIQVSHPNLFTFLGHLQHVTTESTHDMARLTNGLRIKRAKKKMNLINERRIKACMGRFDPGSLRFRLVIVSTQFFRKIFDINIFNLRFNPTTLNTVECTVLFQKKTFDISRYSYTWYFRWYLI